MKKFTLLLFAALTMLCGKAWAETEVTPYGNDGKFPDGVYQIVLVNNHNLCWDVDGGSKEDGAVIKLYTRSNYPQTNNYNGAQLFEVTFVYEEVGSTATSGGVARPHYFYTIRNIQSGKYVDLVGGNLNQDSEIKQYGGDGGTTNDNQVWEIINNGAGFEIRSRHIDDGLQPRIGSETEESGKPLLSTYYVRPNMEGNKSGIRIWDFIRIADKADDPAALNRDVAKMDEIKSDVWYRIAPVTDPAMTVDADGQRTDNGTNVQVWRYESNDNQKWQIEYVTTGEFANRGYYRLKSKKLQSMYIHTSGGRDQNKVQIDENNYYFMDYQVHLWDNQESNSNWLIKKNDDGTYSFYSVNGVALDVTSNSMTYGANVQGHRPNGTPAQKFQLIQVSASESDSPADGLYSIRSAKNFALCVDESSVGQTEGAKIHLWTHHDEQKNQQWYIQHLGDYNYRIIEHAGSQHAGSIDTETTEIRVMEVAGGNPTSGSEVKEYHWNTTNNQKWFFSYAGNVEYGGNTYKSYYIVNVEAALYLDINQGKIEQGTNLQLWEGNATDAQKFVLIPATVDKTISQFDYSTMYYGNLNLRLPATVEGRTMKLNADGMSVSAHITYEPRSIVPQGEGVVLHKTESSGTKKTYKFSVVEDWNSSVPQKDSENCLKGSDDETHEVFADQEADPAHSERCFVYRLTKPLDEHGTELDDPFGFYMTPPTVVGGTRYETGKYLKSNAHLCYLLAKFHAGKMANNNYPNYVSLEVFDDEETDIQALPEAEGYKLQEGAAIFNLAGQRLLKMQKGINIVNGKKVMVK